jgi:hypothetical protein
MMNDDAERLDRMTPEAQRVLRLAQEEAQRFNHNYISTEHLLLGLVRLEEGVSATVLQNLGVELSKVRSSVEFIIGRGDRVVLGEPGLTPRAKKVLDLAFAEASRMKQHYLAPEHLLLGLVSEGEGIAAGVLESLGVNLWKARRETYRVLGLEDDQPEEPPAETPRAGLVGRTFLVSSQSARASVSTNPLKVPPHGYGMLPRYQPWHIDAEQPQKTPVGQGTKERNRVHMAPGSEGTQPDAPVGTLLGWVVVNTGGAFTLTLYDGLADDAPTLAVMRQPPTGACFSFHCAIERGLTYTLEGTPGSVTIVYEEPRAISYGRLPL